MEFPRAASSARKVKSASIKPVKRDVDGDKTIMINAVRIETTAKIPASVRALSHPGRTSFVPKTFWTHFLPALSVHE
jgi:hypothetical protein